MAVRCLLRPPFLKFVLSLPEPLNGAALPDYRPRRIGTTKSTADLISAEAAAGAERSTDRDRRLTGWLSLLLHHLLAGYRRSIAAETDRRNTEADWLLPSDHSFSRRRCSLTLLDIRCSNRVDAQASRLPARTVARIWNIVHTAAIAGYSSCADDQTILPFA